MSIADYHEQFADLYDTFYESRDAGGEARLAAGLLGLDGKRGVARHVLDFGCGTGDHVLALAHMGIAATGFDTSAAMIARARAKTPAAGSAAVRFETGTFAEFCGRSNGASFDGAVSFFNVLNCLTSTDEMVSHLRLLGNRVIEGASLLIDVWNGSAVLADGPRRCIRSYPQVAAPGGEVVRITEPELDRAGQVCTLRYRVLTRSERGRGQSVEFESVHILRFLTPEQYRQLFECAGWVVVEGFPKGRPGESITDHDWYISYLLRRGS